MRCIICNSTTKEKYRDLFDDRYGAPGIYNIYECINCGFARTHPVLKKKQIAQFYKKYYPLSSFTAAEVKKQAKIISPFKAWLFGLNNIAHRYAKRNEKVLDIGSGSGVSLLELKRMGAIAYGVEPDPTAQKFAKQLKLNVHQGFITDDPFPNIQFYLISASQVIEHELEPLIFLNSIEKKLAKDGRVILSFPNYNGLLRYLFGNRWINWHIPYHFNFFTKESFTKLANKAGLKIETIKTITPNLWTMLQLMMFLKQPEEGKASDLWKVDNKKGKPSVSNKIYAIIFSILLVLIAPFNRLIDWLGFGESYLVVLKPNGKKK